MKPITALVALIIGALLLKSCGSLLVDYFGADSAKIVMGTVLTAWGVISVLVIRKHGREYICTNILRFLLSTIAGVYLLCLFCDIIRTCKI